MKTAFSPCCQFTWFDQIIGFPSFPKIEKGGLFSKQLSSLLRWAIRVRLSKLPSSFPLVDWIDGFVAIDRIYFFLKQELPKNYSKNRDRSHSHKMLNKVQYDVDDQSVPLLAGSSNWKPTSNWSALEPVMMGIKTGFSRRKSGEKCMKWKNTPSNKFYVNTLLRLHVSQPRSDTIFP